MKQILPLFLLLFVVSFQSQAQDCTPNSAVVDSSAFVLPIPLDTTTMIGGIEGSACINTPYELVFSFEIPATIEGVITLVVDSVRLTTLDGTEPVKGMPEGLEYSCNTPGCFFDPAVDSTGCAVIYGTPTSNNEIKDYPLTITIVAYTNIGPVPLTFPDETGTLPDADGLYIIKLEAEGSPNCTTVSANDLDKNTFSIQANPNPFSYYTQINIESDINKDLTFAVFNVLGRTVHNEQIAVFEGSNTFEFDATNLPTGMYLYAITDGKNVITKRMLVSRP